MILHDFVMTCHPKTGRVKQMIISKVTGEWPTAVKCVSTRKSCRE